MWAAHVGQLYLAFDLLDPSPSKMSPSKAASGDLEQGLVKQDQNQGQKSSNEKKEPNLDPKAVQHEKQFIHMLDDEIWRRFSIAMLAEHGADEYGKEVRQRCACDATPYKHRRLCNPH